MNCYSHAFDLEEYPNFRNSIFGAKVSGILSYLEEDSEGALIIYSNQSGVVHASRNLGNGLVSTRWGNSEIKEITLEEDKNEYKTEPRFFKHRDRDFYVRYFSPKGLGLDEILQELTSARDPSF
jgi:hypothetical protein